MRISMKLVKKALQEGREIYNHPLTPKRPVGRSYSPVPSPQGGWFAVEIYRVERFFCPTHPRLRVKYTYLGTILDPERDFFTPEEISQLKGLEEDKSRGIVYIPHPEGRQVLIYDPSLRGYRRGYLARREP